MPIGKIAKTMALVKQEEEIVVWAIPLRYVIVYYLTSGWVPEGHRTR
jgi:hypothetical protein